MKQVFVSTAFAMAFAVMAVGCASETTEGSGELGSVGVNLLVDDTDVKAVSFELVCDSGFALNGQFNVNDEQDPPIWAAIMDVPVPDPETGEVCTIALIASDDAGNVLCTGEQSFTVEANETVKVDVVLLCGEEGDDPLGNIDIDATFEIIEGNNCPRLHFLNAVPDEVPAEGSEVTVWVSDKDGDTLTTELTATGGSFVQPNSVLTDTADPVSVLTTYLCDNASGGQTISVTVSDGETACDKGKSFDVVCPGVDPCEGVTCDDTGNECTVGVCTNESAPDCEETPVENGIVCGDGGGELTVNGGFEQGLGLPGWTQFCTETNGVCEATMEEAESGLWSGNLVVQGGIGDAVIKNANIGIGTVTPNSPVIVSVDIKGNTMDGGVVFVQFFSELSGGGVSKEEFVANAVQATDTWTTYTLETTTGPDVGGGVTLQLKSTCGAAATCVADVYFDNASVIFGSGGEAGTCQEGVCVPSAECAVAGDCPDDGNECTDPVCDAGTCGTSNNTNACDGGNGTCDGQGNCVPIAEVFYEQDFESLALSPSNSLVDDGWLGFANRFSPDGQSYLGGYVSAPGTATGGFAAVQTGEGGDPQGLNQLAIISDYNNDADQNAGNLVEANTFQERTIVADDVGKTVTFSFDAKLGNLTSPSTANAFIKTFFDPGNLIDFLTVDTTAIPDTWMRYSIPLVVTQGLVGATLQFGFSATASNFVASQVFYDNVLVTLE